MSFPLLIITSSSTSDSVSVSTQVVHYELEREAEQVHFQLNSSFGNTQNFQRIKTEATRLYPYKGK